MLSTKLHIYSLKLYTLKLLTRQSKTDDTTWWSRHWFPLDRITTVEYSAYEDNQGWGFAHSLIAHLLFRSSLIYSLLIRSLAQITQIKWATVSDLLRAIRTNEWLWANRSGCSCHKSGREQIAQVAHDKWANEWITRFFSANRSFALSLTKKERFAQKNCQKL